MRTGRSRTTTADDLIAAGREVIARGLTASRSGSISARGSDTEFVVSVSGVRLDELAEGGLVACNAQGRPVFGRQGDGRATTRFRDSEPSAETPLHSAIYTARPDAGAVLHASPPYATMVASSTVDIDTSITIDGLYYLRTVHRLEFHPPGSQALASAVGRGSLGCNAILLKNHGAVTVGSDPDEAVARMEYLESLCRMLVYRSVGFPLTPMTTEQIDTFRIAVRDSESL